MSSSGNNCHAVHKSLSSCASVYDCTKEFYLVPYFSQARIRQWNMQLSRLWNGMFGRVEGQYTTPGLDGELTEQPLAFSVPTRCIELMKTKHSVLIFMFGLVTSDGHVMPPFMMSHGPRLNRATYVKCLEEVVLLWTEKVASRRLYFWQEDSAPCNTSKRNDQITLNIWQPNSLDCIPLDFFVGHSWLRDPHTPFHTKDKLKARIMTAFTYLDK